MRELIELEAMRINPRQDNVKLHHFILSLSHHDGKDLPIELYRDIANKFFELAPPSKYICGIHQDKDSPQAHWHIIGSGVRLDNHRANRMTKAEMLNLQEQIQRTHLEKYYEYTKNSEIDFKKQLPQKITDAEIHLAKREKSSEKSIIREQLQSLLTQSTSKEKFYEYIRENGLSTYSRGKHEGIITETGRHIRFSSLGLHEHIQELDKVEQSLSELQSIRNREVEKGLVLEDKDIQLDLLHPENNLHIPEKGNESERDENDIKIHFYPSGNDWGMER